MRRLLLLVLAAGLGVAAFALPRPPEQEGPTFTGPGVADESAAAQGSVWYCPWVNAGAERDSWLMLAAEPAVTAEVTLPSPIPNEEPDRAVFEYPSHTAEPVEVASIVRRGDAPAFVEFDTGPAATSAIVTADTADGSTLVAGDRCTGSVPKLWHLPGGTTREGRRSTLRLFNPFPEPAKATVAGTSEFGDVGLVALSSVDVPGRSWLDVDLNVIVPLLDQLSLTISTDEGLVIPSLVVASAIDEATWPATGLSTTWEFPGVRQTGLVPRLYVSNPGDVEVEVEIDVYGRRGSAPASRSVAVPARTPAIIRLGDLIGGEFGVRIRATGPIAAVVVSEDLSRGSGEEAGDEEGEEASEDPQPSGADRIAGTVGTHTPARRWLLPGPGAVPTAASAVWIMNAHTEPVTVTLQPLGLVELPAEKVALPAERTERIVLPQESGTFGYLIDASQPISAAWSVESGDGVAFIAGVAIDE